MSVPFALPAAVAYGIADFAGGLAARTSAGARRHRRRAGRRAGRPAARGRCLVARAPVRRRARVRGARRDRRRRAGLLLYLRALAVGPMGVVAPLSAVVGAGLPLAVGRAGRGAAGPVAVLARGRRARRDRAGDARAPRRRRGREHGPAARAGRRASGSGCSSSALDATPPRLRPVAAARRPGRLGDAAGRCVLLSPARRGPLHGPAADACCAACSTPRQRAVPAGHPARRPGRQRGGGVALPGGGRAAGPRWCCGERLTRLQLTERRAGADGERAARGGG